MAQPMQDNTYNKDILICRFINFLRDVIKHAPLRDWHVVFYSGTVARIKPDINEINSYSNIPQIKIGGDIGNAIRKGCSMLYNDHNHPYDTIERTVIPIEKGSIPILWRVNWTNRNKLLYNLVIAATTREAIEITGNSRRYDITSNIVSFVISPDLRIYKLEYIDNTWTYREIQIPIKKKEKKHRNNNNRDVIKTE